MKFWRDERGVAAVEMALISPVLILGLLLMLDIGVAVKERLDLDHSTRTGAQAVMANVNDTTEIRNLVVATTEGDPGVSVSVEKVCSCGTTAVSCTSWCTADTPPSVFMNISATKLHVGFLLPQFNVESQTNVQIR
ncbi:TadE/TadG family type IV pilus assembly protein [Roseibium sp.]|uniref:TadE/TadG family type IV pilus assembly protein n=1 Tax=Roseibium sp. TaxID=1936156 RepID=UPI003D11DAA9